MTGSNEFKLNQPPKDGISSVKFSPNTSQFLLVSSWDTSVRLYDVPANSMRLKYQHTGAVLDCAFYDPTVSLGDSPKNFFYPQKAQVLFRSSLSSFCKII
uniref:BUB3 mitotic checkpoint protein n=1 Tax=Neovison vison TaxID=452646 RepID=A0A8C7BKX4_NEOVI